jgi:hypothetical protein
MQRARSTLKYVCAFNIMHMYPIPSCTIHTFMCIAFTSTCITTPTKKALCQTFRPAGTLVVSCAFLFLPYEPASAETCRACPDSKKSKHEHYCTHEQRPFALKQTLPALQDTTLCTYQGHMTATVDCRTYTCRFKIAPNDFKKSLSHSQNMLTAQLESRWTGTCSVSDNVCPQVQ